MRARGMFIQIRSKVYRKLRGVRNRHSNPYATHLPILVAIATSQDPKTVLELGSGLLSTPAILNRTVFPSLERLETYEDDPAWFAEVESKVSGDPRCDLRMVSAVRDNVPENIDAFDLVFVDDSTTVPQRSQTIGSVAKRRSAAIVVIHDFEQRQYGRVATAGFDHVLRVSTFTPQTGICWNDTAKINLAALKSALALVEAHWAEDPTDFDKWVNILAAGGKGE